jgi:hypothetical protein
MILFAFSGIIQNSFRKFQVIGTRGAACSTFDLHFKELAMENFLLIQTVGAGG